MTKSFEKAPRAAWELDGIQTSPFACMGGKPPLMMVFAHRARDESGNILNLPAAVYPSIRGFTYDEMRELLTDPMGPAKNGLAALPLREMMRVFQAASTFHSASEEELAAKLPQASVAQEVVIMAQPAAQAPAANIA